MENVLSLEDSLANRVQEHLDLADTWYESGDLLAYDDHMKIAESILTRVENLKEMEIKNRKVL